MNVQELIDTARKLVADDKGLLAMKDRCPVANAVINAGITPGINADNDKNGSESNYRPGGDPCPRIRLTPTRFRSRPGGAGPC